MRKEPKFYLSLTKKYNSKWNSESMPCEVNEVIYGYNTQIECKQNL